MLDPFVVSIAREYVETIERIEDGSLSPSEMQEWDRQRTALHHELHQALKRSGKDCQYHEVTKLAFKIVKWSGL